MSAAVALPIVGFLLIALVLVRDYARRDRLQRYREQRRRRRVASSWIDMRSERTQMRECADHGTVVNEITRTLPQAPHTHHADGDMPGRRRRH